MTLISSPQNDRVKLVRLLQRQAKARRKHQRLVLEGVRLMADALAAGARPDFACYVEDAAGAESVAAPLLTRLRAAEVPLLAVTPALMADMADTETPQGVLGVFPWPERPHPAQPALVVVADGWRDPGNLGTLIRTAAAAGVDLVALTPGTVDPFNPKTLRAGMGGHYRVAIGSLSWPALAARFETHAFYLADAAGELPYDAVDWRQPAVLVVGGEAHGFDRAALHAPHRTIAIPMTAGAESLNAAVAAGILIFAARRHALG